MASRLEFDISRSKTFRSLRASAARSETCLVGLKGPLSKERSTEEASDVSMVGSRSDGLPSRATGIVAVGGFVRSDVGL